MPEFDVWSEGFRATGDSAPAHFHGVVEAPTFDDACDIVGAQPNWKRYYNSTQKTIYACKMFDNEADARRRYG